MTYGGLCGSNAPDVEVPSVFRDGNTSHGEFPFISPKDGDENNNPPDEPTTPV